MKATIITIVIGALGTIPEGLVRGLEELEIEGCAETIETTTLFRSVIPIVIGALGTISKGLVREPEELEIGRAETYETTEY